MTMPQQLLSCIIRTMDEFKEYSECNLCPRRCGVNRNVTAGYCGAGNEAVIAKTMLHRYEEPVISGTRGSGAVFFSGCNLKCVYCQNGDISRRITGKKYDPDELAELFLSVEALGAHNINLVTAAHYAPTVIKALLKAKKNLTVPVVYNSSGYESVETVEKLAPLIDVWLPDLKYYSSVLSGKYSGAGNYFEAAFSAIKAMLRSQPEVVTEEGLIKKGVIIRHLVLPGCRNDSIKIMKIIAEHFEGALVSLMRQYTPEFAPALSGLNRRVTSFEYESVLSEAVSLGLRGFFQDASSASARFTPDFSSS